MSLMGVDIGQGGVKAAVFDYSGNLLTKAYQEYPTLFPSVGFAEIDSRKVIESAFGVIRKAALAVRKKDPVAAIGIASCGESFTAVSKKGEIISNAMTTADFRAQSLVDPWTRRLNRDFLYQATGHTPYHIYSIFKLLWLKEQRPDVWGKTWRFFFCADLLSYYLTGETVTDYTLASRSMLFDVRNKKWSSEILKKIGMSAERLPDVLPSGKPVGTLRPEIAGKLGLDKKTTVAVAGHDQPCGGLGVGAAEPGCASYSIGTAECICPAFDRLTLNPELMKYNLAMYPHVIPDTYTTVAFSLNGGNVLKWVRDNLAREEAGEAMKKGGDPYEAIIKNASSEPSKLVLIPHFCPTGTPYFDQQATGVLFGLTLSTTRPEIWRAFLEGITLEMKWNLDILANAGLKMQELRAHGGGAQSEIWMQIKADIFGIPLTTMRVTEATCMGAALLAGGGAGLFDPREMSRKWAQPIRIFRPRPKYTAIYEKRFALYKKIYVSLSAARKFFAS